MLEYEKTLYFYTWLSILNLTISIIWSCDNLVTWDFLNKNIVYRKKNPQSTKQTEYHLTSSIPSQSLWFLLLSFGCQVPPLILCCVSRCLCLAPNLRGTRIFTGKCSELSMRLSRLRRIVLSWLSYVLLSGKSGGSCMPSAFRSLPAALW